MALQVEFGGVALLTPLHGATEHSPLPQVDVLSVYLQEPGLTEHLLTAVTMQNSYHKVTKNNLTKITHSKDDL